MYFVNISSTGMRSGVGESRPPEILGSNPGFVKENVEERRRQCWVSFVSFTSSPFMPFNTLLTIIKKALWMVRFEPLIEGDGFANCAVITTF